MDYIVLLTISLFFLFVSKYSKINGKGLTFGYIIFVSVLSANRDLYIPDTLAYIEIFKNLSFNLIHELQKSYMEPCFIILSVFIKYIFGSNYKIYFFIITLISLLIINKAISNLFKCAILQNKYNMHVYSLVIYMLTFGFSNCYIVLRAGLAFSIVTLAFSYIYTSKIKFMILFAFSLLFHNSTIILLIVIPFILKRNTLNKNLLIIWFMLILPFLFIGYQNYLINLFFYIATKSTFLFERFFPYLNKEVIVNQKNVMLRIVILIFASFIFSKNYYKNKHYELYFIIYLFGLTIYSLFINIAIIGRIAEMYIACLFVLLTFDKYISHCNFFNSNYVYFIILYFAISNVRLIT